MDPNRYRECSRFGIQNRPWRPSRLLDAFWSPLGSLLAPLGSLLAPFGAPWLHFGSLLVPFGILWCPFGNIWCPLVSRISQACVGTPIRVNPSLRPRAELCRRHLDKLYCSGFGAAFKNRRAKTPADIIKDNPQAPTETEIRVFPRHLTGHPYWTPFIPFYVDLYEDDWSSEPFKIQRAQKSNPKSQSGAKNMNS
jgi:hypothetical protein